MDDDIMGLERAIKTDGLTPSLTLQYANALARTGRDKDLHDLSWRAADAHPLDEQIIKLLHDVNSYGAVGFGLAPTRRRTNDKFYVIGPNGISTIYPHEPRATGYVETICVSKHDAYVCRGVYAAPTFTIQSFRDGVQTNIIESHPTDWPNILPFVHGDETLHWHTIDAITGRLSIYTTTRQGEVIKPPQHLRHQPKWTFVYDGNDYYARRVRGRSPVIRVDTSQEISPEETQQVTRARDLREGTLLSPIIHAPYGTPQKSSAKDISKHLVYPPFTQFDKGIDRECFTVRPSIPHHKHSCGKYLRIGPSLAVHNLTSERVYVNGKVALDNIMRICPLSKYMHDELLTKCSTPPPRRRRPRPPPRTDISSLETPNLFSILQNPFADNSEYFWNGHGSLPPESNIRGPPLADIIRDEDVSPGTPGRRGRR